MANYPVRIHVKQYSGRNAGLIREYHNRIEVGNKIEAYLNEQMRDEWGKTFNYYEIADAVGLRKEAVKEILFAFDGGSGGITIWNHHNKPLEDGTDEE